MEVFGRLQSCGTGCCTTLPFVDRLAITVFPSLCTSCLCSPHSLARLPVQCTCRPSTYTAASTPHTAAKRVTWSTGLSNDYKWQHSKKRHAGEKHTYIVGSLVLSTTYELLEVPTSSQFQTFTRTFYNGANYHSKAYIKGQGKRNNQICHFNSSGWCKFGQIELFALAPDPVAMVKVFQSTEATLLQQAGHPCCQVLDE